MINLKRLLIPEGINADISYKHIILEIALVTGGILIALAIDNWNNKRVEQVKISDYYEDIQVEFKEVIQYQKKQKKTLGRIQESMVRSLKIIKSKNKDSIPTIKKLLGYFATTWPTSYSMPITEEFIDLDYINKVQNDSLKLMLKKYVGRLKDSRKMEEFNASQYNDRIEPYINENINYQEIVLSSLKKRLVEGGPKTDFEKLSNDLNFWNVINFKIETTIIELSKLKWDMKVFEIIYKLLEQENKI